MASRRRFSSANRAGQRLIRNNADRMPGVWVGKSSTEPAFGSFHAAGANFAMADGSVRFIADSINSNTATIWGYDCFDETLITKAQNELTNPSRGIYQRLSTRADELAIGDF